MAGAGVQVGLGVVPGALVLILDKKTNGGTESYALLDAGLELNKIFLVALSKMMMWADVNVMMQGKSLREWSDCSDQGACGSTEPGRPEVGGAIPIERYRTCRYQRLMI